MTPPPPELRSDLQPELRGELPAPVVRGARSVPATCERQQRDEAEQLLALAAGDLTARDRRGDDLSGRHSATSARPTAARGPRRPGARRAARPRRPSGSPR